MDAKFELRGEVLVVELNGRLDFESTEPFRRTCWERLLDEKVVFDFRNLNFVGSHGLKDFVDTLDHMAHKTRSGVKFCAVSSEFRRLFDAAGLNFVEIYDSKEKALLSFVPQVSLS